MTKLAHRKRACGPYETDCAIHDAGGARAITIQLHARHLELRLKGCRAPAKTFTYDKLFWHLAGLEASLNRAAKAHEARLRQRKRPGL